MRLRKRQHAMEKSPCSCEPSFLGFCCCRLSLGCSRLCGLGLGNSLLGGSGGILGNHCEFGKSGLMFAELMQERARLDNNKDSMQHDSIDAAAAAAAAAAFRTNMRNGEGRTDKKARTSDDETSGSKWQK